MKKFVKDWLVNFALVLLSVYVVFVIVNRNWEDVSFAFELLLVTLAIRLLQMLTSKFTPRYPILETLLEFVMVTAVVLSSGWLLEWYIVENIWLIIIVIAIVYTAGYVLDLTKANRDIAFINEQIRRRREKQREETSDDC